MSALAGKSTRASSAPWSSSFNPQRRWRWRRASSAPCHPQRRRHPSYLSHLLLLTFPWRHYRRRRQGYVHPPCTLLPLVDAQSGLRRRFFSAHAGYGGWCCNRRERQAAARFAFKLHRSDAIVHVSCLVLEFGRVCSKIQHVFHFIPSSQLSYWPPILISVC